MQLPITGNRRQPVGKYLPDFDDQRFAARQLSLHKVDIKIEILVIEFVDHFAPDESAEFFEIYDKARQRVWLALDGYDQVKVVAMPVFIGTGPEYFSIFLWRPGGIVQLMRGVEMLLAADVDHALNFDVNIESCPPLTKPPAREPVPSRIE